MRIPALDAHMHMPFLFRRDGRVELLYSQSQPRMRVRNGKLVGARPSPWKLHWLDAQAEFPRRLHTGLPEEADECSPTYSEVDGGVQVSFIGRVVAVHGTDKNAGQHRLYVMKGPSIKQLGPAKAVTEEDCYCGFNRPDLVISSSGKEGVARATGRKVSKVESTFANISRISYRFDAPSELLITGIRQGATSFETVIVDIESGKLLGELSLEGSPCYKPALLGDQAVVPGPPSKASPWRLRSTDKCRLRETAVKCACV